MKDMELLTEKDMKYFRKKEREGTAIIMDFSAEQLLNLDFGFWANKNQEEITDMEVEQWLANHDIEVKRLGMNLADYGQRQEAKGIISVKEEQQRESIVESLLNKELSEKQQELVKAAISAGMGEKQIVGFINADVSIVELRAVVDILTK